MTGGFIPVAGKLAPAPRIGAGNLRHSGRRKENEQPGYRHDKDE